MRSNLRNESNRFGFLHPMNYNFAFQTERNKPYIGKTVPVRKAGQRKCERKRGRKNGDSPKNTGKVVTLPSGLQYEVINEGNVGTYAKATDQVQCHYEGTLIDGTLFDSSIKRGQPATFGVSQVIPGWVEALQLMPEGAKWKLYIPSELAYGAQGAGEMIPPHSTLIFEVELLKVLNK